MRIAVALLTLLVTGFCWPGAAVESQPEAQAESIRVEQEGGKVVWMLTADGRSLHRDLLRLYARSRDLTIIFNPRAVTGEVTWTAPEGRRLQGDDIDLFVANALEQYRFAFVEQGANQLLVVPFMEVPGQSKFVSRDELAACDSWRHVSLGYEPRYSTMGWMRARLADRPMNSAPRSSAGFPILLFDRVDRLRELLKWLDTVDEAARTTLAGFDLPQTVTAAQAVELLNQLFVKLEPRPTFAASGKRLLVQARESDMKVIAEAVADLE